MVFNATFQQYFKNKVSIDILQCCNSLLLFISLKGCYSLQCCQYLGLVGLWCLTPLSTIFQLYIDLWATFPGANMVQGRNTLGYLRTRPFYIPEKKYAYKYASNCHFLLQSCVHAHVWWKSYSYLDILW
jgi:hypothetical protein